MILREAPMKDLIARRDELERQVAGINAEIATRNREASQRQCQDRAVWARLNPCPMLETGRR